MVINEFSKEREKIKIRVVETLYDVSIFIGVLAVLVRLISFYSSKGSTLEPTSDFITFLGSSLLIYVRFRLVKRNIHFATFLISNLILVAAFYMMFLYGTAVTIAYLLMITVILSNGVIINIGAAIGYTVVCILVTLVLSLSQDYKLISYSVGTPPNTGTTLVFISFTIIIVYITKVGYSQIEHYVKKSFDYAKELEELNRGLEEKVRLRTKQLEESFNRQAETVHAAAVIGGITQPLMHDLSSPISALKGSVMLLEKKKEGGDIKDLVTITKESTDQIERIVNNARELMQQKKVDTPINPHRIVSMILTVLKNKLNKGEIKVTTNIDESIEFIGITGLFERIITNVLLNAIEELIDSKKEKKSIDIHGQQDDDYIVITIKDSGRGISAENLGKIFETSFSLKGDSNLGFGLPFVKQTIEKYFNGNIKVESEVGSYTKFILTFKKIKNAVEVSNQS